MYVVNTSLFLTRNGIVDGAVSIVVSVNVCVCARVDADSYRGLGSHSGLTHTLRFAVILLVVSKKEEF